MQQRGAPQVAIVAVELLGRLLSRPFELGLLESRGDQSHYTGGDLILQAEHVLEPAFEPVRPDMSAGRSLDQLAGNANPVAYPADTALEHVAYPEFAPDLLDIDGLSLVGETRIARDHEQRLEARQRGDDFSTMPSAKNS